MNEKDILKISNSCLQCKNAKCINACPIKTNIPKMIELIKKNEFSQAYKMLYENNIFSGICSKICPFERQCEGNCAKRFTGNPIKISSIENFLNEWAFENNINIQFENIEKKDKKVAIIGSGPAGLACAYDLLKNGYEVTIFEKNKKLGGILRYGIPDFRLEKVLIDNIVEKLEKLGLKIKANVELEKDIFLSNLQKEYSSIFIALGAQKPTIYTLCNEKCSHIYMPDEFLKSYNEGKKMHNLGKTIIIGGGNVAIDCALVAKKIGAESVSIVYRRDEERIPARQNEIEEVLAQNINIVYLTKVLKAEIKSDIIKSVECIKTKIEQNKVIEVENSNFYLQADSIIYAIGLVPNINLLNKLNLEMDNGLLKIDDNSMTSQKGIFAGGDITEHKSNVSKAVASGKSAAVNIIKYIEGEKYANSL